jgi:DNA uptake protein ComE-like DNA-binding protein
MQTQINCPQSRPVGARLGHNHGYRIEFDTVALNAELAITNDFASSGSQWAVQLWACDAPYAGGPLSGIKVAEAPVDLAAAQTSTPRLDAQTPASVPAGPRDYSMVLVLASGVPGAFDQVLDFANYPARERFTGPQLEGNVGYAIDGDEVVIHSEGVLNTRAAENLSGSISLSLSASLDGSPVDGSPGIDLARVEIGRLAGQTQETNLQRRVPFQAPSAGQWKLSILLREWTAVGYVTRDSRTFDAPYLVPAPAAKALEPVKLVPEVAEPAKAPKAVEAAEAETPVAEPAKAPQAVEAAKAETPVAEPAEAPKAVEAAKKEAPALRVTAQTARKPVSTEVASADRRVSVQHASLEELSAVTGLNRKLAAEIVKARPFASLDDLVRVHGIGAKMLPGLRSTLKL